MEVFFSDSIVTVAHALVETVTEVSTANCLTLSFVSAIHWCIQKMFVYFKSVETELS